MSIPNLPVNFKDDILAASNPKRKYHQTFNPDGSVSLEDVTVYSQEGSEYGAKEIIEERKAINNIYNERILDIEALELVTEPGFFVDAQVVKELNGKISGAAGQIVYCGLVNLLYNSSTDLQGVVDDAPDDIFDNMSNYAVLLTLRNASGTPYNQVSRLTYEVRTAQRVLVIDGYGSGFVSGHVVSVSVIIVKKQ